MTFIRAIMRTIDIVYNLPQNYRREHRELDDKITVQKDIVYNSKYPDMCTADYFYAERKDNSKYPVVLYIHGGGWEAGDKKYRSGISKWYADMGWFVVNINYGLSPEVKFPIPVQHVVDAYNHVVENAEKLNLDLNNFVVTGDSAGAYFSLMLAAIDRSCELQKKLECKLDHPVQCLVLNCGMYDLRLLVSKRMVFNLGNSMLKDFINTDRKNFDESEYADYVSPYDYITEDFPPCFVTYAKKDIFCGGQGELLISKLARHGVYYEVFYSRDYINNHCFSLAIKSKATATNNQKTKDFLDRFKSRKSATSWMLSKEQLDDKSHRNVEKLTKKADKRIKRGKKRNIKAMDKLQKHNVK